MESGGSDSFKWNIAVDGSERSEAAFNIVFNNLRKEDDYTIVSHVYSNAKDYLSFHLKPENIKQDYEAKLIGTHSSKWSLIWEHREKDLSTREHIMEITERSNCNILALGYTGSKGPKQDPTLLGSAVEYMAHNPVCPALIVKSNEDRKDKENGAFRWLVCSDGSEKSYKSLRKTIEIIDKSKDELIVIVVAIAGVNAKVIEEETNAILEEEGVINHKFESIQRESDEATYTAITDYINVDDTPYIDFVTIANQGSGYKSHTEKKYFGRVAKAVLTGSIANVLIVF